VVRRHKLASSISPDGKHHERNQQRERIPDIGGCATEGIKTGGGAIEDKETHERTHKANAHRDV
jgi:hypothetical protein